MDDDRRESQRVLMFSASLDSDRTDTRKQLPLRAT